MLRALARIDLGAIARNCARLAEAAAPARLCAVVKADGYGHGAVPAARAALAGGAAWLAVGAARAAGAVAAGPGVGRGGARTPCAPAEEPDRSFLAQQLAAFEPWARGVA